MEYLSMIGTFFTVSANLMIARYIYHNGKSSLPYSILVSFKIGAMHWAVYSWMSHNYFLFATSVTNVFIQSLSIVMKLNSKPVKKLNESDTSLPQLSPLKD